MKRLFSALLVAPIRLYQRLISPAIAPRCRYYPTCSSYAVQAIRELGPIRGLILAAWRLLRCNPWSHGGFDELSDRTLFRDAPVRSSGLVSPPPGAPTTAAASGRASNRADLT